MQWNFYNIVTLRHDEQQSGDLTSRTAGWRGQAVSHLFGDSATDQTGQILAVCGSVPGDLAGHLARTWPGWSPGRSGLAPGQEPAGQPGQAGRGSVWDLPGRSELTPPLIKGWLICDLQLCPVRSWGCQNCTFLRKTIFRVQFLPLWTDIFCRKTWSWRQVGARTRNPRAGSGKSFGEQTFWWSIFLALRAKIFHRWHKDFYIKNFSDINFFSARKKNGYEKK